VAKELPPSVGPTAALVAIDARTGAVLAMVGGRNYHQVSSTCDHQGERQRAPRSSRSCWRPRSGPGSAP